MLSEPLSLLILLSALALSILAPTFHYHQFGEATRMARDAGFSALFLGGGVMAVFSTIRAFRREVESGTLEMALAHPVSRCGFFLAKTLGCLTAYLVFAVLVFVNLMWVVWGADIGGVLAARMGTIARIYGPCLMVAVLLLLLPLLSAAALNRFFRMRFVLTVFRITLGLTMLMLGTMLVFRSELIFRYLPVAILIVIYTSVLLVAASAAAVRFHANGAASAVGVLFLISVPAIGNFYLTDALTGAGSVSWGYLGLAFASAVPAWLAFLAMGAHFINGRDI